MVTFTELKRMLHGKVQLLLLIFIPLTLACLLAGLGVSKQASVLTNVTQVENGVTLGAHLSSAVLVLEKERTYSRIYLLSNGTLYGTELSEAQARSDQALAAVTRGAPSAGVAREPRYLSILSGVSQLPAMRTLVAQNRLVIGLDDDFFTVLIEDMLVLIGVVAVAAPYPELQLRITVLYFVSISAEHAGLEEGAGVQALSASGWPSRELWQQFVGFTGIADATYQGAITFEPSSVMAYVIHLLDPNADPTLNALERLESWMSYNQTANLSHVPMARYFEIFTTKLDLLEKGQLYIADDAITAVKPIRDKAILMMAVYSVILAVVAFCSVLVVAQLRAEIVEMGEAEMTAGGGCGMTLGGIPPPPPDPPPMYLVLFPISAQNRG
eukprot:RCo017514